MKSFKAEMGSYKTYIKRTWRIFLFSFICLVI